MHNLHFLVVSAEDINDVKDLVYSEIADWGNDNNWKCIGGIVSQDGKEQIDNLEQARWNLEWLKSKADDNEENDNEADEDQENLFDLAINQIRDKIWGKVIVKTSEGDKEFEDLSATKDLIINQLKNIDFLSGNSRDNSFSLYLANENLKQVSAIFYARNQDKTTAIPLYREWEFDKFGLTDLTDDNSLNTYLVMLDMHS